MTSDVQAVCRWRASGQSGNGRANQVKVSAGCAVSLFRWSCWFLCGRSNRSVHGMAAISLYWPVDGAWSFLTCQRACLGGYALVYQAHRAKDFLPSIHWACLRSMFGGCIWHVCAAQVASRSPTQTRQAHLLACAMRAVPFCWPGRGLRLACFLLADGSHACALG